MRRKIKLSPRVGTIHGEILVRASPAFGADAIGSEEKTE